MTDKSEKRRNRPIDTGGLQRKAITGGLGFPVWLHDLMQDTGWDSHIVEAIELGGRGVLHPDIGWVSVDELRELAEENNAE